MRPIMNEAPKNLRLLLRQELIRRIEKNPKYSLRAFAKCLGLSHSLLSLILSGKRNLTTSVVQKIVDHIELDAIEKRRLLFKYRVNGEAQKGIDQDSFYQMELDTFAIIAEWHHYAILSLLEIENSKFEAKWISKKLGITQLRAKLAMERLKRLSLVAKTRGRWRQSTLPIKIDNKYANDATRRFHRELLEKAIKAITDQPWYKRDFSSMTFAMDPSFVPLAAKLLRELERDVVADLEKKGKPKVVYNLTVQLIPASLEND